VKGEEGSLTIFGLFIFLIILMIAGMAVDLMRYERVRVQLQNTADRAVLAAGSLRQPNDPKQVVREYFEREGLEEYLAGVDADSGLNFREVQVQTRAQVPTLFMKLFGVDKLVATSASAAVERFTRVEVSLVLDISSSMANFDRIDNLRDAGEDFINTLFESAEPGQVSVSVIPYAGQVNAGPVLSALYNVSPRIARSQCVDFDPADYNSMALSTVTPRVGSGHFDPWHGSEDTQLFFCPSQQGSTILPMSGDPVVLRQRMRDLTEGGNTSIEIGVKWGAAMLDPGTRPVIDQLIVSGHVDPTFSGRPFDYPDPNDPTNADVLKVMVIMTDGENWDQWMMDESVKTGPSPIFVSSNENQISIQHGANFFVPHNGQWQATPWAPGLGNTATQLDWEDVWARHTVRWVAWNLYARALGANNVQRNQIYWTMVDGWLSRRMPDQKNQHLATMCDTLRAKKIPVFTVAFEAPPIGVSSMQQCATSPSHFFDVDGIDIRRAFRAIAGTIHQLRLTQ
jgi:glutaredoxin-related protein